MTIENHFDLKIGALNHQSLKRGCKGESICDIGET